jgi:two-component system response regulator RstA
MIDSPLLLIIEDDIGFARLMTTFLESEGFKVVCKENGEEGRDAILALNPDLAIIDMMLPDITGIEICRAVRDTYHNPIMMLTAQDEDMLEVAALNEGFDDCLHKPVRPHILKARINALLRRGAAQQVPTNNKQLQVQDVKVDLAKHEAYLAGEWLELTGIEFKLLSTLMQHAGEVIDRDNLYLQVRGIEYDGLDRSIDTAVSQLRKKLQDDKPPYRYLKTLRGRGYLFVSD